MLGKVNFHCREAILNKELFKNYVATITNLCRKHVKTIIHAVRYYSKRP